MRKMIVESHAHYAHASFAGNFRYLSWEDNWELKEGTLEELLQQMQERGIAMSVEPGIGLDRRGSPPRRFSLHFYRPIKVK